MVVDYVKTKGEKAFWNEIYGIGKHPYIEDILSKHKEEYVLHNFRFK